MKLLLVSYIYGKDLIGGAERFMAGLTQALVNRGHSVDVATTTAGSLQAPSAFGIHWVKGYPAGITEENGIPVHRFDVRNHDTLQHLASKILLRRVFKDLKGRSYLNEESESWIQFLVTKANQRPAIYQHLYRLCRGPSAPGLTQFLKTHAGNYDAVLATMVPFNTMASAVETAKETACPVGIIPLFHPLDWYHHWKHFYDVFKKADHLFPLNDYSASLFGQMGCNTTRLGVGFDPKDFPADPNGAAKFRPRFNLPDSGAMLLFVGRKIQSKRYDLAIETTRKLRLKGNDVFLVMAGPDEDQKAVSEKGIYYLNRLSREDLLLAYQACDILLEPTEFESFGIIFCEAWMYEKPVIGNRRCPAVASLIRHGEDGVLCLGPEEFMDAVGQFLQNPELGTEMGRTGRQKVLSEYTWNTIAEKIEMKLTKTRETLS